MQWSNYYLIPIVLIGGLFAFGFGRAFVGKLLGLFARKPAPAASIITQTLTAPAENNTPLPRAEYRSKPLSLADRYDRWGTEAIEIEDAQELSFMALVKLDQEDERRKNLMNAARKYSKDHALRSAYVDNRSGATNPNV